MAQHPAKSLRATYASIAAEWHPTLNGDLTPGDVTPGSNKRVYWKCLADDSHRPWPATVNNRTSGTGCPQCSGRVATPENSLQALRPDVAADWHPTKNEPLTPGDVKPGSNRMVWWLCSASPTHGEWQETVCSRTAKKQPGCRRCVLERRSLKARFPEVAAQWHPTKNGDVRPEDVMPGTSQTYWWKCDAGDDHEWPATPKQRTRRGKPSGCPFCTTTGGRVSKTNSLLTIRPDIAMEWHPTLNGDLTANDVTHASGKTVWWQCSRNPRHEPWPAKVAARTVSGTGCPECVLSPRSRAEVELMFELALFLPIDLDDQRVVEDGVLHVVDIVSRPLHLCVELDGNYWHLERYDRDVSKTKALSKGGWRVVRIRQHPLLPTGPLDLVVPVELTTKQLADAVLMHLRTSLGLVIEGLDAYLKANTVQNMDAAEAFIDALINSDQSPLTASKNRLGPDLTCDFCGETFYRAPSQVKGQQHTYCSRECRRAAGREDRTCAECGTVYNIKKSSPNVLCPACRENAAASKRMREFKCAQCGVAFWRHPSAAHPPKYCSIVCFNAAGGRNAGRWRQTPTQ